MAIPLATVYKVTSAEVQLVPFSELGPGQAAAIRRDMVNALLNEVSSKLNIARPGLVVRDLMPANDLDFTPEDWYEVVGATVNTYETLTTGTMGDKRWVGIYGVKLDGDARAVTALRFNIGGSNRAYWQLQGLSEMDGFVGLSPMGIVIPQNMPYTIARYVRSVSSPDHTVLKGIVVEPRGLLISP